MYQKKMQLFVWYTNIHALFVHRNTYQNQLDDFEHSQSRESSRQRGRDFLFSAYSRERRETIDSKLELCSLRQHSSKQNGVPVLHRGGGHARASTQPQVQS